jgi:hypothetical protein
MHGVATISIKIAQMMLRKKTSNARPIFKYYFYSTRLFFFIGWGLDRLAEHAESEQQPNQESQSTLLYRQLAQGLTAQLNEQPEKSLTDSVRQFQL